MSAILSNLQVVRLAIKNAAIVAQRDPASVHLLAVSKTFPESAIRAAYAAGQRAFGENYLQESLLKIAALKDLAIEWHFIGPIQSNKTRDIAENFAWVHGVERLKIAERLSAQRPHNLPPLNICLQVNVSGEASKSGVTPSEVESLAHALIKLPGIKLRGLMAIPAPCDDPRLQQQPFAHLAAIFRGLNSQSLALDTLSMGMSHDFPAAIAAGATLVRIGTAIFGDRPPAALAG
jgi:pyridoxal phosphate enzyme (YggS family)